MAVPLLALEVRNAMVTATHERSELLVLVLPRANLRRIAMRGREQ